MIKARKPISHKIKYTILVYKDDKVILFLRYWKARHKFIKDVC